MFKSIRKGLAATRFAQRLFLWILLQALRRLNASSGPQTSSYNVSLTPYKSSRFWLDLTFVVRASNLAMPA